MVLAMFHFNLCKCDLPVARAGQSHGHSQGFEELRIPIHLEECDLEISLSEL